MPGHGEAYPDCGSFYAYGCIKEHEIRVEGEASLGKLVATRKVKGVVWKFRRSCGRASCPVCYQAWASREAHRALRRLKSFRPARYRRVIHVVASPPSSLHSVGVEHLRPYAARILRDVGMVGGLSTYHPFRQDCLVCGEERVWKTNHCPKGHTQGFVWKFSPHFHALGYGWILGEKVASWHRSDGWVVVNEGVRDSTYGTIQYLLSHAGVWVKGYPAYSEKYHTSISWFGALTYNKLRLPQEKRAVVCPLCGSEMRKVSIEGIDWNAIDPPLEPYAAAGSDIYLLESLEDVSFPQPVYVPPCPWGT